MKSVKSLGDLHKYAERGMAVVDADGIDAQLPRKQQPKPEIKPEPPKAPHPPPPAPWQDNTQMALAMEKFVNSMAKLMAENKSDVAPVMSIVDVLRADLAARAKVAPNPTPKGWEFHVERDGMGRTTKLVAKPQF